jgi:hypothetical protein
LNWGEGSVFIFHIPTITYPVAAPFTAAPEKRRVVVASEKPSRPGILTSLASLSSHVVIAVVLSCYQGHESAVFLFDIFGRP